MKKKLFKFLFLGIMVMTLTGCEGEGQIYRRITGAFNEAVKKLSKKSG